MLRRALWLTLSFLGIGLILWYFWSLGSVSGPPGLVMELRVEKPQVEIRHAAEDEWTVVTGTVVVVAGDTIRTGREGRATLQLFEMSEQRLGASTELQVGPETSYDSSSGRTLAHLRLQTGRVWSRVLRMVDLESSMKIETNRVVATVRGTAFDLDAASTSTWIHVTHGAVALRPAGASSSVFAAEDEQIMFDDRGMHPSLFSSSTVSVSLWVQENAAKDEAFLTHLQAEREQKLSQLGDIHPDQLRDRLTIFSERFHLLLAGDDAPNLYARYVTRRLYAVKKMMDAQMSGGAFQALSAIEGGVIARMRGARAPEDERALAQGIHQVAFLLERVAPDSSLYRLKQRLEDLQLAVLSPGSPRFLYARLLTIEARLNETSVFLDQGALQAAAQEIEAAHQGILNMEPDLKEGMSEASQIVLLREKLSALKAREASLRRMIALRSVMLPRPPVISTPSDTLNSPSSTLPLPPTSTLPVATSSVPELTPASSTPPLPTRIFQPAVIQLASVHLLPPVSSLVSNTHLVFAVEAQYTDGTTRDVTAAVRWSSSNLRLGFFVGSTLYASAPGTVTINASYTEGSSIKTTSHDILITP